MLNPNPKEVKIALIERMKTLKQKMQKNENRNAAYLQGVRVQIDIYPT